MQIEKAIEKAEKAGEIEEIIKKGGFLCSGYVLLDCERGREEVKEWNLNYYNPKSGKITHVRVWNDGHEVSDEDEPLREKEYKKFAKKLKISAEKAIEIAEKHIGKMACIKVILSLQKDGNHEYWSVAFMSKMGSVSNVKVDMETGEVIFSEKSSLIERKFNAS